ncbi:unnamed protein product [Ophioblennius macclurei]
MECVKNCCRKLVRRRMKDPEIQVITMKMPPRDEESRRTGATDDYLLSKLPPDGKEVPFVLPTFKASYVQPKVPDNTDGQSGPQSSARCTYAARKAELLSSSGQFIYSPESSFHQGQVAEYFSPGSTRRDAMMSRTSPGWTLKQSDQQRLSSSMFDLSAPHAHKQRLDSTSSPFSSTSSSMMDSIESSLDSITLSGDERELGKVCVRLNYQEALEQLWITLVECSDLNLHVDALDQQKIGFKAVVTVPKPVHFKSTVKPYSQDVSFMETFVFTLHLQQLRCSALVLRLQTLEPRKRTAAECVLSLRQLQAGGETEHWLDLNPLSRSSACHSELHLATCFQPVNSRIQLQVLAAQNLPASSSPLTQAFYVKVELLSLGKVVLKKKTRALKASGGRCQWAETLHFPLASLDHAYSLAVKLCSRSSVRRKQCLGQVQLGFDSSAPGAVAQWKDTMAHPEKVVEAWHQLGPASSN